MGLAEKKLISTLESGVVTKFESMVAQVTGKNLKVFIDWSSFATADQLRELKYQCLGRIAGGVSKVVFDETGKEAFCSVVDEIRINYLMSSEDKQVSIGDGILTIGGKWDDFKGGIFTPNEYKAQIEELI